MDAQIKRLKKQRKLLVFVCSVLALIVFVAGIYAFVQRGIAVENEKKAIEAIRQTMECEKKAMKQKELAEKAMAEALRAKEYAFEQAKNAARNK